MKKTAISVDRLEIRLKGISPQAARGLVDGLGDKLLMQLTRQHRFMREGRAKSMDRVNSGVLQIPRNSSPSDLRGMVASKIAESIILETK